MYEEPEGSDMLDELREIVVWVEGREAKSSAWGGRGSGFRALFSGPSGTGKTMAAEVLARHLGRELIRVDPGRVVTEYIGETEKNLADLLDRAERSGAILLFDEADALFGKRTEVSDAHDRYANQEVSHLVQRLEEFGGLVVLTTSREEDVEPTFLRRCSFVLRLEDSSDEKE